MAVRIADSSTIDFEPEYHVKSPSRHSMWQRLGLSKLFAKDGDRCDQQTPPWDPEARAALKRNWSRRVGVGLPRAPTFKRQNSERREHLEPVKPCPEEKRALSLTRQRAFSLHRPRSSSTPPPIPAPRVSAPAVTQSNDFAELSHANTAPEFSEAGKSVSDHGEEPNREFKRPLSQNHSEGRCPSEYDGEDEDQDQLSAELDSKWILNLSMHFRDKSDREKFFVTYAQEPTRWKRVTVSCDYRAAEPDSLEMDLKELQFQRDKSAQIYESIRDSLTEIQFYDTVTNLKLETTDGRLHVHVTEDVNEIIPYPPIASVAHLANAKRIRESEIAFDSHLSGFVYRVKYQGRDYIKKEIPGPDTVDEFLYEINALYAINGSSSVIDFRGIIVDEKRKLVKGLLIDYAEQGALVDLIYDYKNSLPLERRLRWAKQAVEGLREVHEAGFVQGDFTLSNIVIDKYDNAKIIDINRRGCPVGWEPPEIAAKIKSNQRISMYIGVKSDLYQLGMTLWAIAAQEDEPERCDRPLLYHDRLPEVPQWYRSVVHICLSERPQDRLSARDLLSLFPREQPRDSGYTEFSAHNGRSREHEYIEPSTAVEREDLERFHTSDPFSHLIEQEGRSTDDTLIHDPLRSIACESYSSIVEPSKAGQQSPERGRRRSRDDEIEVYLDNDSQPQIIPISPETDQEEIVLDGHPYLISRSTFSPEDLKVLEQTNPDPEEPSTSAPFRPDSASNLDTYPDREPHPQLDRNPSDSSKESQSTPRNPPSTSRSHIPVGPPPLDLAIEDLVGFGGNPALEEQSPHEPRVEQTPSSIQQNFSSKRTPPNEEAPSTIEGMTNAPQEEAPKPLAEAIITPSDKSYLSSIPAPSDESPSQRSSDIVSIAPAIQSQQEPHILQDESNPDPIIQSQTSEPQQDPLVPTISIDNSQSPSTSETSPTTASPTANSNIERQTTAHLT